MSSHPSPRLHVNVDHVATIRQARRISEPDPVAWALAAERAGAQGITCHLRKDRRHIQDADVVRLRAEVTTLLNLETSLDQEMVEMALVSGADEICLVPENRAEVTTEGGLDVVGEQTRLARVIPAFVKAGALVSLFVDPDPEQVAASADLGAHFIELHTGSYANADGEARKFELARLVAASKQAHDLGLRVNAGHGLDTTNIAPIAVLPHVQELNIGHSLVARAVFVGVAGAITEMFEAIRAATALAATTEAR
ncbi:MAG: pyridoxine 5-phosphate synthase [Planctomycetota bacterium]|jgi:pyridoxine 5-phosphate synthase